MRNLAGVETCETDILAELKDAGINAYRWSFKKPGEVPSQIVGVLAGWQFERAWYYWVCKGSHGLPIESARRLFDTNRNDVRVDGHCACPSPDELCGGFAVDLYHVDSQDGLIALATELRRIRQANVEVVGSASKWLRSSADDGFLIARNDAWPAPLAPERREP